MMKIAVHAFLFEEEDGWRRIIKEKVQENYREPIKVQRLRWFGLIWRMPDRRAIKNYKKWEEEGNNGSKGIENWRNKIMDNGNRLLSNGSKWPLAKKLLDTDRLVENVDEIGKEHGQELKDYLSINIKGKEKTTKQEQQQLLGVQSIRICT
ncbi:hypothetical protein FQA39_LY01325 [Lamprigera yunnana]|nr:hypothetical protein FQA39_LY01325 [Lamprigera yunnana]